MQLKLQLTDANQDKSRKRKTKQTKMVQGKRQMVDGRLCLTLTLNPMISWKNNSGCYCQLLSAVKTRDYRQRNHIS